MAKVPAAAQRALSIAALAFATAACSVPYDPALAETCVRKGSWPFGLTDAKYACSRAELEAQANDHQHP